MAVNLLELANAIINMDQAVNAGSAELARLQRLQGEEQQRFNDLSARNDALVASIADKTISESNLARDIANHRTQIVELTAEVEQLQIQKSDLEAGIGELRRKIGV